MCGIAGFNWPDKRLIKSMTEIMAGRGPDDSGYYLDRHLSLGHRRLAVLDLSSAGHQPMFDENNEIGIVYNGEIYNYQEIQKELIERGYSFKTRTDTETLLFSFKEWGIECVNRFIGMFAFAIYDLRNNQLYLARDHMGIKPLYYFKDNERFIFSSTISPLLVHKINTTPNKKVIRDFLLYNTTDHLDETFFSNVHIFPKGHFAIYNIKQNKLKWQKWWENTFTGNYTGSYNEAVQELLKRLEKSVHRRLLSDVPVGTCLSGGIDSSAIACLIKKSKNNEIKTFSAVFPQFKFDESSYINLITSKTHMDNYQVIPTAKTMEEDLGEFIKAIGEPVASTSPYVQFKVFKLSKENNTTVLLDGQGSDELFAGYHYFYGFYIKGLLKKGKIREALKEVVGLIKGGHYKIGLLSIVFLNIPLFIRRYYFYRKSNISKKLIKNKTLDTSFFRDYYKISSLHNALKFHLDYKLDHLLKWEDRNSMAHSREARVPFLDKDVMKFSFSLPERYIISAGKTKSLLRDALEGSVPDEILERRDKIGFVTPEDDWIREEPMMALANKWFIKKEPICKEYIDLKKTRKMIKLHLQNKKNYGRIIWKTIFLESWLRNFFVIDEN